MAYKITVLVVFVAIFFVNIVYAQESGEELEMEVTMSNEELILLFGVFVVAIVGIFAFLARDVILRRKTTYDTREFESKKDKIYEKYHSDWSDDYEEIGSRKSMEGKFRPGGKDMPDYYKVLGLSKNATQKEIKQQYRKLAKKTHPDRIKGKGAEKSMTEINEAYEVLSNEETRTEYDRFLD